MSVSEHAQALLEAVARADRLFGYLGETMAETRDFVESAEKILGVSSFVLCLSREAVNLYELMVKTFESISDEYVAFRDKVYRVWSELSGKAAPPSSSSSPSRRRVKHEITKQYCTDLLNEYRQKLVNVMDVAVELMDALRRLSSDALALMRTLYVEPEKKEIVMKLEEVAKGAERIVASLNEFVTIVNKSTYFIYPWLGTSERSKPSESLKVRKNSASDYKRVSRMIEEAHDAIIELYDLVKGSIADFLSNVNQVGELVNAFAEYFMQASEDRCAWYAKSDYFDYGSRMIGSGRGIHYSWEVRGIRLSLARFEDAVSRLERDIASEITEVRIRYWLGSTSDTLDAVVRKEDNCPEIGEKMLSILSAIVDRAYMALNSANTILGVDETEQFRRVREIARVLANEDPIVEEIIEECLFALSSLRYDVAIIVDKVAEVKELAEKEHEVLLKYREQGLFRKMPYY